MRHWSCDYVGIPYLRAGRSIAGADCYGLLWLVYRDVLTIDLASYAAETMDAAERAEVAALITSGRAGSPWLAVQSGSEREFDMAVFRRAGIESHVGIVISPGRMLHVMKGGESHIETYRQGRWAMKLIALHRHEACA